MLIIAGDTALALRQESIAAFSGVAPVNGIIDYTPDVAALTGIIQYTDPEDRTLKALTAGGLFDFTREQTVRILGVRGLAACGEISVVIGDRDNIDHDVTVGIPATEEVWFANPLPVLPSQVVKISTKTSDTKGFIDLYVVKGSWF